MAEYRAIRSRTSRWSWAIQKKGLLGWRVIEGGFNEDEVRAALEFYASAPQIIYPAKTRTITDVDMAGKQT